MGTAEWIAATVLATLVVGWIAHRIHRPTTPPQRRQRTIAALRRASHPRMADQVERVLSEARDAKVVALDYLAAHAPLELKTELLRVRADDASDGTILMGVAEIERKITTPGYLHMRHHLRKVLLPTDRVRLLADEYVDSATDERTEALARAIARVENACAALRDALSRDGHECR